MESYKMGIDPYESEQSTTSSAAVLIFKGKEVVTAKTSKSSVMDRFMFDSKLLYFLYFKRTSLYCEDTKKIITPKRLMKFKLKNPGK